MKAFGREVASRTIAGVVAGVVLIVLTAAWNFAPALVKRYNLTAREAFAWALVLVLLTIVVVLCALAFSLYAALRERRRASSVLITANSGVKPSITITNHGDATTYRVDGRIVSLSDGNPSLHSAPFRCELQIGGITGVWDALLANGEWAQIILGSLEPIFPKSNGVLSSIESWTPVGHTLVIRRGKRGQHVEVPNSGAVVEVTVLPTPQPTKLVEPKRFRIARDGNTVNVTQL